MINFLLLHTKTTLISLLFKIFNQFFLLNFEKIVFYKMQDFNSICKVYPMIIYKITLCKTTLLCKY